MAQMEMAYKRLNLMAKTKWHRNGAVWDTRLVLTEWAS